MAIVLSSSSGNLRLTLDKNGVAGWCHVDLEVEGAPRRLGQSDSVTSPRASWHSSQTTRLSCAGYSASRTYIARRMASTRPWRQSFTFKTPARMHLQRSRSRPLRGASGCTSYSTPYRRRIADSNENVVAFFTDDETYTGPRLTQKLIRSAEARLGYRLPPAYLALLEERNGGVPIRRCFPATKKTSWAVDRIEIETLCGLGGEWGIDSEDGLGSRDLIAEWGYPNIGIVICETPSAGHDTVMLDYRKCGPAGEPSVVYIDEDRSILGLAATSTSSYVACTSAVPRGHEAPTPGTVAKSSCDYANKRAGAPISSPREGDLPAPRRQPVRHWRRTRH